MYVDVRLCGEDHASNWGEQYNNWFCGTIAFGVTFYIYSIEVELRIKKGKQK